MPQIVVSNGHAQYFIAEVGASEEQKSVLPQPSTVLQQVPECCDELGQKTRFLSMQLVLHSKESVVLNTCYAVHNTQKVVNTNNIIICKK